MMDESSTQSPENTAPTRDEIRAHIDEKLITLPDAPGVYLHKNADGKVVYIGKAVNLKNRVRSYFNKDGGHSAFTRKMIRFIVDFEIIVTDNSTKSRTGSPIGASSKTASIAHNEAPDSRRQFGTSRPLF